MFSRICIRPVNHDFVWYVRVWRGGCVEHLAIVFGPGWAHGSARGNLMVVWEFSINTSLYLLVTHSFVPIPPGSVVVRSSKILFSCPIWHITAHYFINSHMIRHTTLIFSLKALGFPSPLNNGLFP